MTSTAETPFSAKRPNRGYSTLSYSKKSGIFLVEELPPTISIFLGITRTTQDQIILNNVNDADLILQQVTLTHSAVCATNTTQHFTWKQVTSNHVNNVSGTAFKLTDNSIGLVFEQHLTPTEYQQQASLLEWERTVNSIDDVIHILDPKMRIIRANTAAHQRFGIKHGKLIGRRCHMVFYGKKSPCDSCPAIETLRDTLTHRANRLNEDTGQTFNTTSSPIFDESNNLSMVVLAARDITETVIHEEERRELSTAIEQTTEAVIITDKLGIIQYINPAFSKASGYAKKDAIGSDIRKIDTSDQPTTFYKQLWKQILSGKAWSGTLVNKKKDGTLYSTHSTISPIFDANHEISAFVAVKRDTSKEDSLEKQLQQSVKLEAIGTLAGGIAHDFNNILSAMIGYAQIAKGYSGTDQKALNAIDHIISSGDRAADLIKQILTFSRQEQTPTPFKPLKIQYIIKSVLKMLRSSFPSTIKIHQNIDNHCHSVLADASQIHQVVMNLCTNARQAIGERHGEIAIELSEKTFGSSSNASRPIQLPPGKYVYLKISDTGCGMDEHTIKRIFDPFFSTKPKDHGTGLGLSVVHGIMNKHNSTIEVTSEVNKGTTFSLLFPTTSQDPPKPQENQKTVTGGTERILLVDDEQQITEFLELQLNRLGYKVTPFCDSIKAVQFFRENSSDIDFVITDMTMPNMTGVELSREILSLRPELPIILFTGYSENIDDTKVLRIGIRKFLTKPLKKGELAQVIRDILDNG